MLGLIARGSRSRSSFVSAVVLLALASACPGDDAALDDTSTGPGTGSDTTSSTGPGTGTTLGETGSTGGSSGTSGETTAGTADSGSSDTGATLCETIPEEPLPAVLEVSLEILNDTAEPVYVLGPASFCSEYAVARNGRSVPIRNGFQCGCECPGPPTPTAEAVALDPGQTLVLTWDGRALVFYEEHYLCDDECWSDVVGAEQPLESGPITMTIPVYDAAGVARQFDTLGSQEEICESPLSFSVDFELGTGDLTVPVALSEVTIG